MNDHQCPIKDCKIHIDGEPVTIEKDWKHWMSEFEAEEKRCGGLTREFITALDHKYGVAQLTKKDRRYQQIKKERDRLQKRMDVVDTKVVKLKALLEKETNPKKEGRLADLIQALEQKLDNLCDQVTEYDDEELMMDGGEL